MNLLCCGRRDYLSIRLFAFTAGGGGGRGKQFSTALGDHVRVNQSDLAVYELMNDTQA